MQNICSFYSVDELVMQAIEQTDIKFLIKTSLYFLNQSNYELSISNMKNAANNYKLSFEWTPIIQVKIWRMLADQYLELRQPMNAIEILSQAIDLSKTKMTASNKILYQREQAYLNAKMGKAYFQLHEYQLALQYLQKSGLILDLLGLMNSHEYIYYLQNMANYFRFMYKDEQCMTLINQGLQLSLDLFGSISEEFSECLHQKVHLLMDIGQLEKAYDLCIELFEIRKKLCKFDNIRIARTLYLLGNIHMHQQNFKESFIFLNDCLFLYESLIGENFHDTADCHHSLGRLFSLSDDLELMEYHFKQALKIYIDIYPNGHPSLGITLSNFGKAYYRIQMYPEALNKLDESLELYKKISEGNNQLINIGIINRDIGKTNQKMKLLKTAYKNYMEAYQIFTKLYGKNHDCSQELIILIEQCQTED